MYSAIVDCLACRNKGEIELRLGPTPVISKAFEYLGKSIANGYLYLLCKNCETVLLVDPVGIMDSGRTEKVKGIVCRMGNLLFKRETDDLSSSEKPC